MNNMNVTENKLNRMAKEIRRLNGISFKTLLEIGARLQEAQTIASEEQFAQFLIDSGVNKADVSRYVAVFEHKDVFESYPELKELGTGKLFSLMSIIKAGRIGEFIERFGLDTTQAQMKKNIKDFNSDGTEGEDDEDSEGTGSGTGGTGSTGGKSARDAELEALKARVAELEAENTVLHVKLMSKQSTGSSGKIDKATQRKILGFIHPDKFQQFGEAVVMPLTEASKIINGLAN